MDTYTKTIPCTFIRLSEDLEYPFENFLNMLDSLEGTAQHFRELHIGDKKLVTFLTKKGVIGSFEHHCWEGENYDSFYQEVINLLP